MFKKKKMEEPWITSYIANRIGEHLALFTNAKVAIYPYGAVGRQTETILKERFETDTLYKVDDLVNEEGVISLDEFMKLYSEDILFVFAVNNQDLFRRLLKKCFLKGISAKKMFIVCKNMLLGVDAVERVISLEDKVSLLDIGCGAGLQGRIFEDYGKSVVGLTLSQNDGYAAECIHNVQCIDFMDYSTEEKFDIVWASHMLEHVCDVQKYINKMLLHIHEGGCLAVTVPAREKNILLAHVHSFSAGRLLRYFLCAGIDCRNAEVLEYGYNLSVIIPSVSYIREKFDVEGIQNQSADFLQEDRLLDYLPDAIPLNKEWNGIRSFDGDISRLGWKENDIL